MAARRQIVKQLRRHMDSPKCQPMVGPCLALSELLSNRQQTTIYSCCM